MSNSGFALKHIYPSGQGLHIKPWMGIMPNPGFALKHVYPGKKGLYVEFFTAEDTLNFYAKAVAKGSTRFEIQDSTTVIMKSNKAS